MRIINNGTSLSLPANTTPNEISYDQSNNLILYSESLLDTQIFQELVALLNSKKLSQIQLLNKLKQCNSES